MHVWELHPALVHFPIAFLLGAVALDFVAIRHPSESLHRAANGLLMAGVASGLIAAAAGFAAFLTVPAHTEEAHRWMYWHLGLAISALLLFLIAIFQRWRRWAEPVASRIRLLGLLAAAGLLSITGYLGGQIVYHGGAGIEPSILSPEIRHHHHGGRETTPEAGEHHHPQ